MKTDSFFGIPIIETSGVGINAALVYADGHQHHIKIPERRSPILWFDDQLGLVAFDLVGECLGTLIFRERLENET